MKKIAIIYHSGYGHTKRIADVIYHTMKQEKSISVDIFTTEQAAKNLDTLDDYTTFVFGCPTYMGGPSAPFKAFADATSKKWMSHAWKNKLATGFTNSTGLAGDKFSTLMYFVTLAAQHGMLWIPLGILPTLTKSGHGAAPENINRIGLSLGLATQSDNAEPNQTPSSGDLETAQLFAQRIIKISDSIAHLSELE